MVAVVNLKLIKEEHTMAVSSARNLGTGTGTVSTTSGSKLLVFSATQSFKEGATVVVDPSGTPQPFTIDTGADKNWTAMQDSPSTVSGKSFKMTATTTSRARGGTDSYIIPNAAHFLYRSVLDDANNPDFFTDRKSTRLNSSHIQKSRMPSSA